MKHYRVWTKDMRHGHYTVWTDWTTRAACKRFIVNRWKCWPPFAYVSQARTREMFVRHNGE